MESVVYLLLGLFFLATPLLTLVAFVKALSIQKNFRNQQSQLEKLDWELSTTKQKMRQTEKSLENLEEQMAALKLEPIKEHPVPAPEAPIEKDVERIPPTKQDSQPNQELEKQQPPQAPEPSDAAASELPTKPMEIWVPGIPSFEASAGTPPVSAVSAPADIDIALPYLETPPPAPLHISTPPEESIQVTLPDPPQRNTPPEISLETLSAKIKARTWTWEEMLGTQVFLKLGVTVVVLGMVLFLGYAFMRVGPFGKIVFGYAVAAAMIGAGLWAERKVGYETFGRGIVAGGWGILYFVTYALHFVEASRILESASLAIVALLIAATAAVAFSLRYRHEWTTTFSFSLVFISLGLSAWEMQAAFNLVATCIAGASVAWLAWRNSWNRLLFLGNLATWLCLCIWMALGLNAAPPIVKVIPTLAVLALIGIVFEVSILFWKSERQEHLHTISTVVNFMGTLAGGLTILTRLSPGSAFVWSLLLGILGIASCFKLIKEPNRVLYLTTATLALGALALVTPLRLGLGNQWTPIMRLFGLQALMVIGVYLRERYFRLLALAGLIITFFEILVVRGLLANPAELISQARVLLFLVSIGVAIVNSWLSRTHWQSFLNQQERLFLSEGMSTWATILVVALVGFEVPVVWMGPVLATLALLWHEAAVRTGQRDLSWQSLFLFASVWVALLTGGLQARTSMDTLTLTWIMTCAYLAYARARYGGIRIVSGFFLISGVALFILLTEREAPEWLFSGILALSAFIHLLVAIRKGFKDLLFSAGFLFLAAFLSIFASSWQLNHTWGFLSYRVLSSLLMLVPVYLSYALLKRNNYVQKELGDLPQNLALLLSWGSMLLLVCLCWKDLPGHWLAPALSLLMLVFLYLGLKFSWRDFLFQGFATFIPVLIAVVFVGFNLDEGGYLLSGRSESVGLTVCLILVCHTLLVRRNHLLGSMITTQDSRLFSWIPTLFLTSATLALGILIKIEALFYEKNLIVALIWLAIGVVYLEISRGVKRKDWFMLGHALMIAGAIHALLVNVPQEGHIGNFSLRVLTVLPALGFLAYAYVTWQGCIRYLSDFPLRQNGNAVHLYLGTSLMALGCGYELHRAWVIVAWSFLSLLAMWLIKFHKSRHLKFIAFGLTLATLIRCLAVNFMAHDQLMDFRLNLLTVPLAIMLVLGCYVLEFQAETENGMQEMAHKWIKRPFWLAAFLILTTGFVWYETTGTTFTIWLSLEGFAVMTLGFLFRDRHARWSALMMLGFCVLKLFIFDLRGLTGIYRIMSFIILGVVMIAVSYTYTRFKNRLDKLL